MIFIIYTVIMIFVLTMFLVTAGYKKELFNHLDSKIFKLKFIYGMSAFCLDFTNKHIFQINYENEKSKLSKVNMNHSDENDAYFYMVSKFSFALAACVAVLLFGYVKCIDSHFSKETEVTQLQRNKAGEGETQYNLILEYDGKRENIDISIGEIRYKEKEAMALMDSYYEELRKKMLSSNKSEDCVTEDLNFISEIGEQIQIEWDIENSDLIDCSGQIIWSQIEGKIKTDITAIMSIDEYSKSYVFQITLDKEARDKATVILEKINEYEKESEKNSENLNLTEIADEYDVRFLKQQTKESLVYILIAIGAAIMIYVLKEREIDNKLEERKKQLESDYALIISKLTVLQSSGMTILGAWDKIIKDYDDNIKKLSSENEKKQNKAKKLLKGRKKQTENTKEKFKRYAYEEMKYARQKMKKGYSETEAYLEFGRRCGIHSYIKFANLLEQNIRKGTKGLKDILNNEVEEAFEERKALARKRGDEAGTKLLMPMVMMLIISIVIIIVPAIMSFNI